jgi:hypothetical protein
VGSGEASGRGEKTSVGASGTSAVGSVVGTTSGAEVTGAPGGSARVQVAVGDGTSESSVFRKLSQVRASTAREMTRNQIRGERVEDRCSGMPWGLFLDYGDCQSRPRQDAIGIGDEVCFGNEGPWHPVVEANTI